MIGTSKRILLSLAEALNRGALFQARGAEGAVVVGHEKERRRRGPPFASGPVARQSDGRGHRRGLDGPSMPKKSQKYPNAFISEC
jgi:hypothetical protein